MENAKPRRRRGRPTRAEASRKALAGTDPSTIDPLAVLREVAADKSAPSSARVAACRLWLADEEARRIRKINEAEWAKWDATHDAVFRPAGRDTGFITLIAPCCRPSHESFSPINLVAGCAKLFEKLSLPCAPIVHFGIADASEVGWHLDIALLEGTHALTP
jgi:hypothetical protein